MLQIGAYRMLMEYLAKNCSYRIESVRKREGERGRETGKEKPFKAAIWPTQYANIFPAE